MSQLLARDSPLSYNGVHHLLKSLKQPFPSNKNDDEEIPTEIEMKNFTFIASPLVRSIDTLILSCRQIFMKYPDTKIKIMSTMIEFLSTIIIKKIIVMIFLYCSFEQKFFLLIFLFTQKFW